MGADVAEGRRAGSITLRWSQYDGRAIRLEQEKTDVRLVLPVLHDLGTELDAWRTDGGVIALPNRTILVNKFGRPWRGSNLSKQLGEALAAIPGFPLGRNMHGLRKLAAANLAHAGCTIHEIAAITGHKSLAMIQLYTASVNQEQAAESAMGKIGAIGRRKL